MPTFTLVLAGIIVLPMIIMAIFLLNGKGAFLISGYNTMSAEKKATYDEKALCKAVGWLLLIMSALSALWLFAIQISAMWLFWPSLALFIIVPIVFAIYANTGKRYRKHD